MAHGGILSKDGNSALALERIGIHHARGHLLPFAKDAALPEHGVDKRGLAVVDVRDDRDVADV